MNGKKAKKLRELAMALNGGNCRSSYGTTWYQPKPLLDNHGNVLALIDRSTDRCDGWRQLYQNLKKVEGYRRTGWRELSTLETVELQAILAEEALRRERSNQRAQAKAKKRKAELKALEDFKASVTETGKKLIQQLQSKKEY